MGNQKQTIILFDLDGTLTDSAEGVIRSAQYMQEKMGIKKWADEDLKFIVGPPLMKTFTEDFAMDAETAEIAIGHFRERYTTVGLFENRLYPGIEEMLIALRAKGKRLAVATSKKEETAVRILEHFGVAKYFEVIAYVLEQMKAEKSDVVMVGDRKFDVEGAHAIGIPCISVEYGYGDRAEFIACGADVIVGTTEEVVELF